MKASALLLVLALCWPAWASAQAAAPDLAKAETLVREGRAAEAYDLLQSHERDRAGEPDFDYWLGVAALESGRPDKATIALERTLIVNPDFVGARLDLARAYFALEDFERARLEFKTVLEQSPPGAARTTIDRYLAEIDERAAARLRRMTAYLEGTIGYDSNVNLSTRDSALFVPLFGLNLTLAPGSVKASDRYFSLGGGFELNAPLAPDTGVFVGLDARRRVNFDEDPFDFDRYDSRLGLQAVRGPNLIRLGLSYGRFYLDHRYNYQNLGFALEWRRAFGERDVGMLIAQHNRLRYPDPAFTGNDANQTVFGAGWAHAFNPSGTTFVFGSAHYGNEQDTNQRVDGSRRLGGIRLAAQYGYSATTDIFGSLSAQVSDYDAENFVFMTTRKDKLYELAFGVVWRFLRDWSLRPQVIYTRNDSNIVINDYDRYDVSLTLRRDFR